MKRILPTLADMEFYISICDTVESAETEPTREKGGGPDLALYMVANSLNKSAGTLSALLTDLEKELGGRVLIHRGKREGFGPVTRFGREFYSFCKGSLNLLGERFKCLTLGHITPAPIRIAATNLIHLHALPGAITAHLLRSTQITANSPGIEIKECSYREMVDAVHEDEVEFGVGWGLGELNYPNIRFDTLIEEVPILAIIPDLELLAHIDPSSQLLALFTRHSHEVPLAGLEEAINNKRLALVKSDYQPELRDLRWSAGPQNIVHVDNVEDGFARVRRFGADICCAPSWYQTRSRVAWRFIRGRDTKQLPENKRVTKKMVIYRREDKPTEMFPEPVRDFIDTLSIFISDFTERIVNGSPINPKEIIQWATDHPFRKSRK